MNASYVDVLLISAACHAWWSVRSGASGSGRFQPSVPIPARHQVRRASPSESAVTEFDLRQWMWLSRSHNGLIGCGEKSMRINRKWLFLAAAQWALNGHAAEGLVKAARTRAGYGRIAAIHEQPADVDTQAGVSHLDLARTYERGWIWAGPKVGGAIRARRGNQSQVAHRANPAHIFRLAAAEILLLANERRQMATETKE